MVTTSMSMHMHMLGAIRYETWTWAESNIDLRDREAVAVAPNAGPIALLGGGRLRILTAMGRVLAEIPWPPPKEAATNTQWRLVRMLWTDALRLLCVFANGQCVSYSALGEEAATRFSLLSPQEDDEIAQIESWGEGLVALTTKGALLQALDLDAAHPEVSWLPDSCGPSPTTSTLPPRMAVLPPQFCQNSKDPGVFLSTNRRSLVIVDKATGITEFQLPGALAAPISAMAVAPDGRRLAVFTRDGVLTVLDTALDDRLLSFDTQSTSPPGAMCWCGRDAVLLHWPKKPGLVLVGLDGAWLRFPDYRDDLVLVPEIDGCRVYGGPSGHGELITRVPTCLEDLRAKDSTAPAATLLRALEFSDAGDDNRADGYMQGLLSRLESLNAAINDCIDAAGSEFEYACQTTYLRAASYGKSFIVGAFGDDDDDRFNQETDVTGERDHPHRRFVGMCLKLRILNSLRRSEIGVPLTMEQYDHLGPRVVLRRLSAMGHGALTRKIGKKLRISCDAYEESRS